ncbi:unnamed protein product [Albugo candida]|uniref:Uncharacterized protein n=1 Tax=Albugo candida TaxID=65357 RepID=A0A024G695_9STRA|nr:unnamed protein product [Albugo candida]|eukprot:CCI42277.1 unnamed protein product [Albugo candida]
MPTRDAPTDHTFENAKQMGSPDDTIESEQTAFKSSESHPSAAESTPIHYRQTETGSAGTSKIVGDKQTAAIVMSPEMKIIGGLILLLLFLVFLLFILWDRYGKQVSELYTSNQSCSAEESGGHRKTELSQVKKQRREVRTLIDQKKDDYSMYRQLPTFFYEYSRQTKKPKSHEL